MTGLLPYRTMCYCWQTSHVFSDNQPSATQYLPRFLGCLLGLESPGPALILCHPGVVHWRIQTPKKRNVGEYIFNTPWYDWWYRYETLWDIPAAPNIFWDCMYNSILYIYIYNYIYVYYVYMYIIYCIYIYDMCVCGWFCWLQPVPEDIWSNTCPAWMCIPITLRSFTTNDHQFMYIFYIYIYIWIYVVQ